ncbi:MAG: exodeoxyribonuclease VII small subunit [Phormidesmis sp.]
MPIATLIPTAMPRTKKQPALPENWNYEETLSQIESITHQLETGELPLSEVFDQFTEAVEALQQCDQFLRSKQQQASLLIETLVDENEDS